MTRWEEFFRDDPRILSVGPTQCARTAAAELQKRGLATVLDLGCGTGRDSIFLAAQGFSVKGVDAARSGLEIARRVSTEQTARVEFIEADARELPFANESFDAVYCFGLLHEFTGDMREADVTKVMTEIRRVLKPGGLLVLAVLAGEPADGMPQVHLFTEATFDRATAAFQLVEKCRVRDVGCTGRPEYVVWRGLFER
jgi:ubiquinone/menaquinone biosynthesis C-methylase UbiE